MNKHSRTPDNAGRAKRMKHPVEIKIIGLMGPKTERAIIDVEESLVGLDDSVGVEWISDPFEICKLGPVQSPSVYVNGRLRSAGRIPSVHEVRMWIEEELSEVEAA